MSSQQVTDLVNLLLLLELSYVLPDLLHLLSTAALDDVVSAGVLVGGNVVRVKDTGQGDQVLHIWYQLPLQLPVEHLHVQAVF